ncbi:MAG: hypothetical protein QXU87_03870 [Candidatus Caldarchaeum sp.]
MTSVKLAKDELERLISLCETIAKTGADPYSVDVKAILAKLRSIVERTSDTEILTLDAETLYRVALVIALQHKWLKDRASSLLVDTQLIVLKILSADKKSLAQALVSSWRPIVSAEQLTRGMVAMGLEYFLSLPTRNLKSSATTEIGPEVDFRQALNTFSQREEIELELKKLHSEMLASRDENGEVDYASFISREGVEKTVERAYLTAFIVSEGLAEVVRNPITGKVTLKPFESKAERRNVASMVIVLKEGAVLV